MKKMIIIVMLIFSSIAFAQVDSTKIKLYDEIIIEKQKELNEIKDKIIETEKLVERLKGAYEKTMYDINVYWERRKILSEGKTKDKDVKK